MTTEQRFEIFNDNNPHILEMFIEIAVEAKDKGFSIYSSAGIFEIIRFNAGVDTERGTENFKMTNDFKPYYARLAMEQNPYLIGFFKTSKLKHERYADDIETSIDNKLTMKISYC